MSDHRTEVPQSLQAAPSIGAILLYLSEKDVNWWAAVIGLVFLLAQLAHLAWRWHRDIRIERDRQASQLHEVVDE